MRISENFERSEFECSCGCGFDTVDAELIGVLERVRAKFGAPVTVTSGCRCPVYNKMVGGTAGSQHLLGRAADIIVEGVSPRAVCEFISGQYVGRLGLGSYEDFTHVDSRSKRARW